MQSITQWIMEYPLGSFSCGMLFFAWLGHFIVTEYLMEQQIRNVSSRVIFTLTFTCSVSLLTMYLYQICSLALPQTLWQIILWTLTLMCLYIIPLILIFRFFLIQCKPWLKILVTAAYIYGMGVLSQRLSSHKVEEVPYLNNLIEVVVTNGMYIMALMSAYGSIWCPYIYFNRIQTNRAQLSLAKIRILDGIHFIIDQIKIKKMQLIILNDRESLIRKNLVQRSFTHTSLIEKGIAALGKMVRQQAQDELGINEVKIQQHVRELEALKIVHKNDFQKYKQIVDEERRHLLKDTWMGKLFRLFSFFLMLYSVTKVVLTIWNMFKGRTQSSTDPITRLLNLIQWLSLSDISDNSMRVNYLQYVSFGFMGYLIVSSVRSFTMNVKNFFNFAFRKSKLRILQTDMRVLFLSLIYGIYFLSAVILLQSSLPCQYVTKLRKITGSIMLIQHFTLFDWLFFCCCCLSAIIICFSQCMRNRRINEILKQKTVVALNSEVHQKV